MSRTMSIIEAVLIVVLCALLGMAVFFAAGAIVACGLIIPTANLCGIPAAIYGGPLGLLAGAIVGWKIVRSAAKSA